MAEVPEERWLERPIYDMEWRRIKVADLPELPGPYEYLEKEELKPIEFTPLRWEFGRVYFAPPWRPTPIWYPCLRIWVKPEEKPGRLPWWDITSNKLIYQLFEVLKQPDITTKKIRVTPGFPRPRTIFHVEVLEAVA